MSIEKFLDQSFSNEESDIKDSTLKGFEEALRITQEKGLEIGQQVYHPSDDCVYQLFEINDGIATIGIPDGIKKQFPANELIDPKIAYSKTMGVHFLKKVPGADC
jgi:hypothetical protein